MPTVPTLAVSSCTRNDGGNKWAGSSGLSSAYRRVPAGVVGEQVIGAKRGNSAPISSHITEQVMYWVLLINSADIRTFTPLPNCLALRTISDVCLTRDAESSLNSPKVYQEAIRSLSQEADVYRPTAKNCGCFIVDETTFSFDFEIHTLPDPRRLHICQPY